QAAGREEGRAQGRPRSADGQAGRTGHLSLGKGGRMLLTKVRKAPRVVLYGVSWRSYCMMGRALLDRPALRLTYDRGALQIMTTSPQHERLKHLLSRLLEAWTEEKGLALAGFGSMTFKRKKHLRGLEPDECYWIASYPQIRGKERIDLRVDPPPDVVIEIDIASSSLDRMGIYAILGVPEVWRLDAQGLHFRKLQADGS